MSSNQLGEAIRRAASGIEVSGVNLSYGRTPVLKDVSLTIHPGEFFAFLGPSGCGKTTLLRLIAGFNSAQTGQVIVGGTDISTLPPWKRDVGMVFQSYALWPHMSVAKNVAFGLEERRLPRDEIAARVDQALDLVNLRHLKERRPSQLSGGQQQRVALARTIAIRPKILLLDEPLSNLDARMRVQVRRELRDLQQSLGITTIFVTHDQEEANTICDRIAVMNEGRVLQVGTPMALYDRPADLFVAGFLGTANILQGTQSGGVFSLRDGSAMPAPAGSPEGPARVVFRPQNARLAGNGAAAEPGLTALPGQVIHSEFLGAALRYGVRIGEDEVLVDVPHQAGETRLPAGMAVRVLLDHGRARFFPA
ncbi:MAG: ABC transporter ATP-binding protein [Beijerinckiaceae bacterium]|nr:ABC transporter ATP-binding protein [Beijerinckiaceae bacterium]MCZ8300139.1 ABC transporter ATP-binding protein [Beijerinckiaceae bacterium]